MSINLRNIILGERQTRKPPALVAVTPHRQGELTLLGVENLLQSVAVPEPFSLELAADMDGVTLLARCQDDRVVRQQLAAHYPQARVRQVAPEDDPMLRRPGELAWGLTLRVDGPEYVPLRTFRDDDLLDPGSDPLLAVIGSLSALRPGERLVSRLLLRSLGPEWAQGHQARAHRRAVPENREPSYTYHTKPLQLDGVTMAVLGAGGLAALQGYLWVQDGEILKASLLGAGSVLGLVAAGWGWWRWRKARHRVYDPLLIREKVSRIAFDAQLQVTAFLPAEEGMERAGDLLESVVAAYRHYDHPAGARFKVSQAKPVFVSGNPHQVTLYPVGPGLFGRRSVLGVREAAALWHPPGQGDETPLVERSDSRALAPQARSVRTGAPVGDATGGAPREVNFTEDLLRRHHLYVARTRMGKSTLMHRIVAHKLREKTAGRDTDAIVVVDPHADLVAGLLEQVPENLTGQVRLIDLADESGAPGVNLLDTRVFADRDRTADSVVRVARGLWDQWGPRMQSILEHTVKTLHEANGRRTEAEQYTILDGMRLISDGKFRAEVLGLVSDTYLLDWWVRDFDNWHRQYRSEAIAPVQTRLAYYASSKRARAILGQSRSTIDIRQTILDGGILFVSTAQGSVGRDVSALVGASLLNLVDSVIREQERLPLDRRRGALVVVDEMQSMPGVDYESMLSELGKYGASFILATQSLAKLDDLSPTMQDTILANVGCLAVFQVSGSDARRLVWELGKDRVSEDDVTSLPVHHCYVRATVGADRLPAYSMMVRKPDAGDPRVAARIREAARDYTTRAGEIALGNAGAEEKLGEYRRLLAERQQGANPAPQPLEPPQDDPGPSRNKQRSRHNQPGEDGDDPAGGEKEAEE